MGVHADRAVVLLSVVVTLLVGGSPAAASDTIVIAPGGDAAPGSSPVDPLPLPEGEAVYDAITGDTVWFGVVLQENQIARLQVGVAAGPGVDADALRDVTIRLGSTRPQRVDSAPCTRTEGPALVPQGERLALGTRRAAMNVKPSACDGFGRHLFAVHLDGDQRVPVQVTVIASVVGSPEPAPVTRLGPAAVEQRDAGEGPVPGVKSEAAGSPGSDVATTLGALGLVAAVLVLARRSRPRDAPVEDEASAVRIEHL